MFDLNEKLYIPNFNSLLLIIQLLEEETSLIISLSYLFTSVVYIWYFIWVKVLLSTPLKFIINVLLSISLYWESSKDIYRLLKIKLISGIFEVM